VTAWWNSLSLFAALYLIAFLLALRSLYSWLGIVALVVSALSRSRESFYPQMMSRHSLSALNASHLTNQ